jgi:GntR family transcriptional regulator, arabinose operon transcriptional repressor
MNGILLISFKKRVDMTEPLYEQIYNNILANIESGQLKPGDRVPSEKELSDQYNVSRITSKRALQILDQQGLIERARGKGSFVAQGADVSSTLTKVKEKNTTNNLKEQHMAAFIMPDFADSFGTRLLRSVETNMRLNNTAMLFRRTRGSLEEEANAIDAFIAAGVDGVIVFPVHGEFYNERLLRMALDHFPLVLVDRYLKGISACSISVNNRQAAQDLTEYLIGLGHTRIAFVSPPAQGTTTIEERMQGVTNGLVAHGLPFGPEDCLTNLYSTLPDAFVPENIQKDEETIKQFLESHPQLTAFVVCEYNLALVLEQVLIRLGHSIPKDFSIVCFDSVKDAIGGPHFTHISQNESYMGQKAVELLLAQIDGQEVPLQTTVPYTLVEGNSSGPLH